MQGGAGPGRVESSCERAFPSNSPPLTVDSREIRIQFSWAEFKVSGLNSVEVVESQLRRFNSGQYPVTPATSAEAA